ncbi:C45 family autoproteolytic acyltransferase/hydrolase [Micromonospora sp. WMMD1102]|uniref:C45 family autoproteolytic acyltransferase/hydolase n=1 Tax=Micromonospora sp. WMMD1102 TaxID=3016105 RepID=UPI00241574A9|nr:C45 family peptidase [Micromonospora sp. WMMD1102]MDG4790499.1 C45 family autoproteolytic acyltransferase/hydrolase [Micromonospora sp. WMMD1102]
MTSDHRLDHADDDLPVPLIRVQGTPTECGLGYGAAARDLIGANLEFYLRRFRAEGGLDEVAVAAAGRAFREATRRHHPRVAELLDGVAEGAGARVEQIYALNARTELIYGRHREGGAESPPDAGAGGCTTVGVLGTHTGNGHLLLGQNWDWHPDQRDVMLLLCTRDEQGLTVLTLTEAGMVAKTGLNSAGVGVCVNMLGCDRDGLPGPGVEPGVPYHVLLRAVLEADSLSEALKAAFRGTRNSSINLLLGQAAEAGGELIDLELVPGDAGWLHPVDGFLTHANHLETALPVYDTIKDWGGSSLFRSARARRLLAPRAAEGKVGEADLAALFQDHASAPQAICRHVDERMPRAEHSETVYSVLLDLDDRRLGIAAGPPCGHRYGWRDLATL